MSAREYSSIKNFNKTFIIGSTGSGKTTLAWFLSGKEAKVQLLNHIIRFEGIPSSYVLDLDQTYNIMINESNKTAFIELHNFDEHTLRYFEEIVKMYTIQYLMNEIESKFLFVMSRVAKRAARACPHKKVTIDTFFARTISRAKPFPNQFCALFNFFCPSIKIFIARAFLK